MVVLIVIAVVVIAIIVAIKINNKQEREKEYNDLKEKIHNSEMIEDIERKLVPLSFVLDYRWIYKQIDYHDDCSRAISIFNESISFAIWQNDTWETKMLAGFVEDFGYKPLMDNGLKDGKKHITNEDVYWVFANEFKESIERVLENKDLTFEEIRYYSGYKSQQQPDGTYKSVKVGDEHACIFYKVPKSIDAKQI